jgi:hypothetical protein
MNYHTKVVKFSCRLENINKTNVYFGLANHNDWWAYVETSIVSVFGIFLNVFLGCFIYGARENFKLHLLVDL